MLERDDGIRIPTPPGATVVALSALTAVCYGIVLGWFDVRGRRLPDGSSVATDLMCWDGRYVSWLPPRLVSLAWFIGDPA